MSPRPLSGQREFPQNGGDRLIGKPAAKDTACKITAFEIMPACDRAHTCWYGRRIRCRENNSTEPVVFEFAPLHRFKSSLEDVMMNFAQSSPVDRPRAKSVSSFDATAWLAGLAFLLLFTIVLYLDLMTPGLSPHELASRIAAFP